jgi:hypothetical protein
MLSCRVSKKASSQDQVPKNRNGPGPSRAAPQVLIGADSRPRLLSGDFTTQSKNMIRWDDLLLINAMLCLPATYDGTDCKITPLTEIAHEFYKSPRMRRFAKLIDQSNIKSLVGVELSRYQLFESFCPVLQTKS